MAKKWTNDNLAGALHFVTGNVSDRQPIFRREETCLTFLTQCQKLKIKREAKFIAFVIMPDHFHLIVNPRDGKIKEWIGALKSLSAQRLIEIASPNQFLKTKQDDSDHQVWQESFKALPLWSDWMIWQKINYIHANPIKAKLVKTTREYRWSSFHAFYFEEKDPHLQIDKDWCWPEDVQKLKQSMKEFGQK